MADSKVKTMEIGPPKISKEAVGKALQYMNVKEFYQFLLKHVPEDAHDTIHRNAFTNLELIEKGKQVGLTYKIHSYQSYEAMELDRFRDAIGLKVVSKMENISYYILFEKE